MEACIDCCGMFPVNFGAKLLTSFVFVFTTLGDSSLFVWNCIFSSQPLPKSRSSPQGWDGSSSSGTEGKTEYSNEAHTFLWGSVLCSFFSGVARPKADDGGVRAVIVPGFGMCALMSTIAPLTDGREECQGSGWRPFCDAHEFIRTLCGRPCVFGFRSGSCRMWKIDKSVVNARNSFPADDTPTHTLSRRNSSSPLGVLAEPRNPPAISRLMESRRSHNFLLHSCGLLWDSKGNRWENERLEHPKSFFFHQTVCGMHVEYLNIRKSQSGMASEGRRTSPPWFTSWHHRFFLRLPRAFAILWLCRPFVTTPLASSLTFCSRCHFNDVKQANCTVFRLVSSVEPEQNCSSSKKSFRCRHPLDCLSPSTISN